MQDFKKELEKDIPNITIRTSFMLRNLNSSTGLREFANLTQI